MYGHMNVKAGIQFKKMKRILIYCDYNMYLQVTLMCITWERWPVCMSSVVL